jgi:hypothetical protein
LLLLGIDERFLRCPAGSYVRQNYRLTAVTNWLMGSLGKE